jgi:alkylation response protein AidB-like acyl-CoA dehydrogenase
MKGEVPLMAFADQIDGELADPKLLPQPKGPLAIEIRQAELAKRQFVYAARAAAMKFGLEIDAHQEVLAALADVAIHVYAMDSVLSRTLQVDGGVDDPVRVAMTKLVVNEAREIAFRRSRDVLANAFSGDELQAPLAALTSLYTYVPYDTAVLREVITPAVLDKDGYPYSY